MGPHENEVRLNARGRLHDFSPWIADRNVRDHPRGRVGSSLACKVFETHAALFEGTFLYFERQVGVGVEAAQILEHVEQMHFRTRDQSRKARGSRKDPGRAVGIVHRREEDEAPRDRGCAGVRDAVGREVASSLYDTGRGQVSLDFEPCSVMRVP
jgi:hypothetical protein